MRSPGKGFSLFTALWILACLLPGCATSRPSEPRPPAADPTVRITLIHLNDVYEITPVEGGRSGGLERVATLRRQLLERNPNTLTILAGDLLSPSAMGLAKVDGSRLAGRQMVAVMNTLGLDLAIFGNHEFDLSEEAFRERLAESRFKWFSGNVSDAQGRPFPGVARYEIFTAENSSGHRVRIGFIGLTLVANRPAFESYEDPIEVARRQVRELEDRVDVLVAVTHLPAELDVALAESLPELKIILGGHEHENLRLHRGPGLTPIIKADANARSVYVHDLSYDTSTGELAIESRFVPITDEIDDDPKTRREIDDWVNAAFAGFRRSGFEPSQVVTRTTVALDGRESRVRNQPTHLTRLIAQALLHGAGDADLAVYHSGSIRIDDVLPPGPVTQYDVIRILPFGGDYLTVEIRGELLRRTLDQGEANRGSGGYLQTAAVSKAPDGSWQIGGEPLDPERTYRAVVIDYLVSGREKGLDFLNPDHPDLEIATSHGDIRLAVIAQLKKAFGGS
ncbi:MAG: bifunctional metallophosphatase/5'-nucleotidase [Thermoanaerobaculia bacterium]